MLQHFLINWPIALTALILPLTALSTNAADQPGNLTAAQVQTLKQVGISIAVPRYVPAGFKVASVTTVPCPATAKRDAKGICTGKSSYQILYRQADQTCFAVYGEFTRGIGGGAGDFAFPVETALLGKTEIGFGRGRSVNDQPASPQQLKTPQPNLNSFPIYQPGTPNIYGIRMVEKGDGCGSNRSITPLEMEKILKSLSWL
jgi:hypothetical protein